MKDVYVDVFRRAVKETQQATGYELPETLEAYVSMLLAAHMEKPDFLPTHSFAKAWLTIDPNSGAKQLGDTCLFVTGVFPEYACARGMNINYYVSIGKGSYACAAQTLNGSLFESLSKHFDLLRTVITLTTNPHRRL
jgi:hypothetical protein